MFVLLHKLGVLKCLVRTGMNQTTPLGYVSKLSN